MMKSRVWIMSELYHPDETATGYLLKGIAEGLAGFYDVHVLSGLLPRLGVQKRIEIYNGVTIRRCLSTSLSKDILIFRIIHLLVVSISMFWNAVRVIQKGESVLVVTNPPTLPFIAYAACRLRKAKYVLLIHDVYPEVLAAADLIRRDGLIIKFLGWLNTRLYRGADIVIVLGRDMNRLVRKKLPRSDQRVVIIENWADLDSVFPTGRNSNALLKENRISKDFVIQYAGNIGRTHGIEVLFESALKLKDKNDIKFLFIGFGAKKKWLESEIQRNNLTNIGILETQPRSRQNTFLNACDVAVISFIPGMAGVSVPSRMYNIMAAGKPIIAVTDEESELAMVVREENIGWVVTSNKADDVVAAILAAKKNSSRLASMGRRARRTAEKKYSYERSVQLYKAVLQKE